MYIQKSETYPQNNLVDLQVLKESNYIDNSNRINTYIPQKQIASINPTTTYEYSDKNCSKISPADQKVLVRYRYT